MKLEFQLLVVDDDPEGIEQAIETLNDDLITKGFTLERKIVSDATEESLREITRTRGKEFDLVMIDYKLGGGEMDGAVAAQGLRRGLPYTDMVFYSSLSEAELLAKLAEHSVPGVFVARRDNLGDALTGLADTVIGKTVDLNHMRGIAMAEVAEMDVAMAETLARIFGGSSTDLAAAGARTIARMRSRMTEDRELFEAKLSAEGLVGVVCDSRLCSLADKYRALRRALKCLRDRPISEMQILDSYETDVIDNRNMLAHVKEERADDGSVALRWIKRGRAGVKIDEKWMLGFRSDIHKHRRSLRIVCNALHREFGGGESCGNGEESEA